VTEQQNSHTQKWGCLTFI